MRLTFLGIILAFSANLVFAGDPPMKGSYKYRSTVRSSGVVKQRGNRIQSRETSRTDTRIYDKKGNMIKPKSGISTSKSIVDKKKRK